MADQGFSNLHATSDPTVNHDRTMGYAAGDSEWTNIISGIKFLCVDATAGAARWVRDRVNSASWPVGTYRVSEACINIQSGTPSGGKITAMPVKIDHRISIDQVGFRLLTAASAGGLCRVGIASSNSTTGFPDKLLGDSGDIDLTTGAAADKVKPLAVSLDTGTVWVMIMYNTVTTPATVMRSAGGLLGKFPSTTLAELAASPYRSLDQAYTYGAFPATLPTSWVATSTAEATLVGLRRAT